jgi:hypothetical protein
VLVRELLHEQAHGEIDAQRADLVVPQVIDDGVRDADLPAGGLEPGKLGDVALLSLSDPWRRVGLRE